MTSARGSWSPGSSTHAQAHVWYATNGLEHGQEHRGNSHLLWEMRLKEEVGWDMGSEGWGHRDRGVARTRGHGKGTGEEFPSWSPWWAYLMGHFLACLFFHVSRSWYSSSECFLGWSMRWLWELVKVVRDEAGRVGSIKGEGFGYRG